MIRKTACLLSVCTAMSIACYGQDTLPNAPLPAGPSIHSTGTSYTPPTQGERFKSYIKGTYGPTSIIEAAVRGGIDQKRDEPSEWPQGGQGYANRFGSSMGMIAIRGTTTYLVADLFKEDLRPVHCGSGCQESKFKVAFKNSFMARKGNDGHEAISIARISAPWAASAVAVNTWYPSGYGGADIGKQAGISYGLLYVRNYVVQLFAH